VRLFRTACAMSAIAAVTLLAGYASAAPTFPVAHRAIYEISAAPDVTGEVADLTGVEAIEWAVDCDGASLLQRTKIVAAFNETGEFQTDSDVTVWEAADGSRLRFLLTVKSTGEDDEDVNGLAMRRPDGQIDVTYTSPHEASKTLPGTVLFPWQFTREVMEVAQGGGKGVSATVLRGNEPDIDPAHVRSQVLKKSPISKELKSATRGDVDVLGETAWRFASAIFEDPEDAVPTFELTESVTESGVRLVAEMHFPDLTLRFKLRAVQKLPMPACQ
jgi:hypothetical protein